MSFTHDDAVVGGGILGLAHAATLARLGRRVALFERSPRAQGASVRNFGMLWPIGQPLGELRALADRSLEIWREILPAAGLWHDPCGSLHVAYHPDEVRVLEELIAAANGSLPLEMWTPGEVAKRSPAVRQEGLRGAMFSSSETCVDPREVVARLPGWLAEQHGVTLRFDECVTGFEKGLVRTSQHGARDAIRAERLWVCSGIDLQTLYPEALRNLGIVPVKLQMMRTQPQAGGWRLGPMLAAGLTLRHYKSFDGLPGHDALKSRIAEEYPAHERFGIHVLASQNGRGEVVLGDSHEYGADITPFDREEIDHLVLDYLRGFLELPGLHIAERWHGIYGKHPTQTWVTVAPAPGVTCVTGIGGAGMTLSFAVAERTVAEALA